MKSYVYLFVTIFFVKSTCAAKSLFELNDTTKMVLDINIENNVFTKGMSDIMLSDVYRDTLYIVNKDKLIVIDVKSGKLSTSIKVNAFLAKQLKLNKYATQIVVRDNNYYFSFIDEIYSISRAGEIFKVYSNSSFINYFEVSEQSILIASRDTIKVIAINGNLLSTLQFGFTDAGFIKTNGGISYSEVPEDIIYEFCVSKNYSINLKKIAPINYSKVMEEPYISYSIEDYLIAFDYWKRNAIYVLRKGTNTNEVIKTINLKGFKYPLSRAEIQKEEGIPNFKIGYSNGIFYLFALVRDRLRVSSFAL